MIQEEYRHIVQACRHGVRKAEYHLLNLVKDVKSNQKSFYNYIRCKRKTRENVGPLQNGSGDLMTKDMEKAEITECLICFSPSW